MPTSTLSIIDPRREELLHGGYARGSYKYAPKIPAVKFSLGWELEANHKAIRHPGGVQLQCDGSVNGDGAEYVAMPTVVKSITYTLGLLKDLVHAPELNTDKSCGFHVHLAPIGVSLSTMRKWALIAQSLAKAIEDKAFAAVPDARQDNQYCHKIDLNSEMHFSATKYSNSMRYNWLNIVEMFRPGGIRTIEVRLLGNTHRWKYLAAWSLFSLQLGKEAWKVLHNPTLQAQAIQSLSCRLDQIIQEVKPLDKRAEPMPFWIYAGLKSLGADPSKWDRPLATLVEKECETLCQRKRFYSDNQATIGQDEDSDEERNLCPHGIDLDNEDCGYCDHDNGNCDSTICLDCQDNAHDNRELCAHPNCFRCNNRRAELEASENPENREVA